MIEHVLRLIVGVLLLFSFRAVSVAQILPLSNTSDSLRSFQTTISNRFDETSFSLREISSEQELMSVNGTKQLMPASVLKLLTTYAALKSLGGEFRFPTEVYFSSKPKATLSIKGFGDPAMTEERLFKLADDLFRAGIKRVEKIVLDTSMIRAPRKKTGINPYQAANSALNINFNSVNVRGQLVEERKVFSTTSFSPVIFKPRLSVGATSQVAFNGDSESVDIVIGHDSGMAEDSFAVDDPVDYYFSVWNGVLRLRGIEAPTTFSRSEVPSEMTPLTISYSKDLAAILADMNRYSSNFIAQQIAYQLGRGDKELNFEAGLKKILNFAEVAKLPRPELFDASGLDRKNRLSTSVLTAVIARALSDLEIAPDFQASLSKFAKRGTLKRRSLNYIGEEKIWAKTGSIDQVSSIAGTIELRDKKQYAFAIITNGPFTKAEMVERENLILRSLLAANFR